MTEPFVSQGGMKPEGQMNPVSVLEPKLDPQDREVLCSAMRHCSATPNISKDGKSLKLLRDEPHLDSTNSLAERL
ncbi:hypothetical protein LOY43_25905 [Pseudomonas sp. B21-041]|uniref:hypothetical protein n=1 Tax=Pseudomonas TaxID=286 RepID=UPI0021600441|nr:MULTISPECIES: hypothetical protein [Pseudomonas]UVL34325.1 hypothetical protein LOY43_25905 [Pseudomonas sp. B21-041]WPN74248.1 hypothetical protein QMK46_26375 [Pseudomonas germanica]